MIKRNFFLFLLPAVLLFSCSKNSPTTVGSSNVPNESVNISINITGANYTALTVAGGAAYLNGGYRGIVAYRYSATPSATCIVAYDRACTYNISSSAAIVTAENNGNAVCSDCGSTYSLYNGSVNTGPTTIGLKAYKATFDPSSNILTITN
jgi:Rieske Fe-S protein